MVVDVQRSVFVCIYQEVERCDATLECFLFSDSCAIISLRQKHSCSVLLPGVKIDELSVVTQMGCSDTGHIGVVLKVSPRKRKYCNAGRKDLRHVANECAYMTGPFHNATISTSKNLARLWTQQPSLQWPHFLSPCPLCGFSQLLDDKTKLPSFAPLVSHALLLHNSHPKFLFMTEQDSLVPS